jgi:integrase/recombinase XerD
MSITLQTFLPSLPINQTNSFENEVQLWLKDLSKNTSKTYRSAINMLYELGILIDNVPIMAFATWNHNLMVDTIKKTPCGSSEKTKQLRAGCLIAFINHLSRRYPDHFKHIYPCRHGSNQTFFKVRDKCKTNALTHKQWTDWLYQLSCINQRDYLIAMLILQGAKRVGEVLSLQTGQIDYATSSIQYRQSKTGGLEKFVVVTYPRHVMDKLKSYIGDRVGMVFITSTATMVGRTQISLSFERAGVLANLPIKVHPHVLRASSITYMMAQGYSSDDIMKLSGHTTSAMVHYYNKSELADNLSKEINLV